MKEVHEMKKSLNQLEDITCWPIIKEIMTEDPNFLCNDIENVFVCQRGTKAIVIKHIYYQSSIKLYLWEAGFQQQQQSISEIPKKCWILLEDLQFNALLRDLIYDNGWLFVLTSDHHLYCRSLCHIGFEMKQLKKNEQRHLLYPFESINFLDKRSRISKESYICDNVKKVCQGIQYTVILNLNKTKLTILKWRKVADQPLEYGRELISNFNIDVTSPRFQQSPNILFEDIAIFNKSWAALTNLQTLLVQGYFNSSTHYEDLTIIDLKEKEFPNQNSEDKLFHKIYATSYQILLLTTNGSLHSLIFDKHFHNNKSMITDSFENSIGIQEIYSHYSSISFVALTFTNEILVYFPQFSPASAKDQKTNLIPIKLQSIPDIYSTYVVAGETPIMTFKQNFADWKQDTKKLFFNDPTNSDLYLDIWNRGFFIHKAVLKDKETYFHRQYIERGFFLTKDSPQQSTKIEQKHKQLSVEPADVKFFTKNASKKPVEIIISSINVTKEQDNKRQEKIIYKYLPKLDPEKDDLIRFSIDILRPYFKYLYDMYNGEENYDFSNNYYCDSLPKSFKDFTQVIKNIDPEYYSKIRESHQKQCLKCFSMKPSEPIQIEKVIQEKSVSQKHLKEKDQEKFFKEKSNKFIIQSLQKEEIMEENKNILEKKSKKSEIQKSMFSKFGPKFKKCQSSFSGWKCKYVSIHNLTYWPILNEIIEQKPDLIRDSSTKVFICDNGNLAFIYQRFKYDDSSRIICNRLFIWVASYVHHQRSNIKRGKLLYEDDGQPIVHMFYDNGLLFTINKAKQINCIPVFSIFNEQQRMQNVQNSLQFNLNPLLQKTHQDSIPNGLALKVVSNNYFTLLLGRSNVNYVDTYVVIWRWKSSQYDEPRIASKTYLLTYGNFLSKYSQKNDCFIDVACIVGGGYLLLTAFNLLFAAGTLSSKINIVNMQRFDLKEYFPTENILQMFVTKTRVLFLTDYGNLCGIRLDCSMITQPNGEMRFHTFGPMINFENAECITVYSNYLLEKFVALVKQNDKFRYLVFSPRSSSSSFNRFKEDNIDKLIESTLYASIPETCNIFLNGETPFITKLSKKVLEQISNKSLLYGFNNPAVLNQMNIEVNNYKYFVDPKRLDIWWRHGKNFDQFFKNFSPNISDAYLRYRYTGMLLLDIGFLDELIDFLNQIHSLDTTLSSANIITDDLNGRIVIKSKLLQIDVQNGLLNDDENGEYEEIETIEPIMPLPERKIQNQMTNIDCWPLLNEILSKKPEFLSETQLKEIFICDQGRIAIMRIKMNTSINMIIWFATYVYDRRPNLPWIILNEFIDEEIFSLYYDNELLFIIDKQKRLHCKNVFQINEQIPTSISERKSESNQRRLLLRHVSKIAGDHFSKCVSGESYMVALNNDMLNNIVYVYQFPEIVTDDDSFKKKFFRGDNFYTFSASKFLTKHYLSLLTRQQQQTYQPLLVDRFIDIACFQNSFALLTEKQLLFLFGKISKNLNFKYPKYFCIDLKVWFKIYYHISKMDEDEKKMFQITKIFPTKTQLIMLSSNYKLFFIKLDALHDAAIDRFPIGTMTMIDQRNFHEVYSHYSSSNFLTVGEDGQSWQIWLFTEPWPLKSDRQLETNLNRTTIFQSIPDAYATFINGETPFMTSILFSKFLDSITKTFNDPTKGNRIDLLIHNRTFHVDRGRLLNWNHTSLIKFLQHYPINFAYAYLRYLHVGVFMIDHDYYQLLNRFVEHIQDFDQVFYHLANIQRVNLHSQQPIIIQNLNINFDVDGTRVNRIELSTILDNIKINPEIEIITPLRQMILVNNPVSQSLPMPNAEQRTTVPELSNKEKAKLLKDNES